MKRLKERSSLKQAVLDSYRQGVSPKHIMARLGEPGLTRNMIVAWVRRAGVIRSQGDGIRAAYPDPRRERAKKAPHGRKKSSHPTSLIGFNNMRLSGLVAKEQGHPPVRPAITRIGLLPGEPKPIGPVHDFPPSGCCLYTKDDISPKKPWRFCGHQGYPWCEFHRHLVEPKSFVR